MTAFADALGHAGLVELDGVQDVSPCVNPFCERLLIEGTKVCPHCETRHERAPA